MAGHTHRRTRPALAGAALALCAGLASPAAVAAAPSADVTADSNRCRIGVGAITPGGDHVGSTFTATQPVTSTPLQGTNDLFADGIARLAADATIEPQVPAGVLHETHVVLGDSLYSVHYMAPPAPLVPGFHRIGSGWGSMRALAVTDYAPLGVPDSATRNTAYALAPDGTLNRWVIRAGAWGSRESAPGFSSVKSMAHISQTATYDTFLVNTRGGALYTVRIPVGTPMKPVVKVVRTSGWAAYESLVAEGCGRQGTLVAAIDRDTGSVRLHAVGHATGTTTPIVDLGTGPTKVTASPTFLWTVAPYSRQTLFGE